MKKIPLFSGFCCILFLCLINNSFQAFPTVPLQAWLPKASGDTSRGLTRELSGATPEEFASLLFPNSVNLTALCTVENPIVLVIQDIHYTSFTGINVPESVQWIKTSQSNAKYALDIGYVSNDVSPTLEEQLKSKCSGKSLKKITMGRSSPLADFQALTSANPQSFFVFTGVLSNNQSFLDKYQLMTPHLFAGVSISLFLSFFLTLILLFLSNIKGARK